MKARHLRRRVEQETSLMWLLLVDDIDVIDVDVEELPTMSRRDHRVTAALELVDVVEST